MRTGHHERYPASVWPAESDAAERLVEDLWICWQKNFCLQHLSVCLRNQRSQSPMLETGAVYSVVTAVLVYYLNAGYAPSTGNRALSDPTCRILLFRHPFRHCRPPNCRRDFLLYLLSNESCSINMSGASSPRPSADYRPPKGTIPHGCPDVSMVRRSPYAAASEASHTVSCPDLMRSGIC